MAAVTHPRDVIDANPEQFTGFTDRRAVTAAIPTDVNDRLHTYAEVARILNCSTQTVYRIAKDPGSGLNSITINKGAVRFRHSDIIDYLDRMAEKSKPVPPPPDLGIVVLPTAKRVSGLPPGTRLPPPTSLPPIRSRKKNPKT